MSEIVKLNLQITIPKRWLTKFMQMLDCMRWAGNVGASRTVAFYADGDGDFRPFDFKVNGEEVKSDIKWREYDKNWIPKNESDYDCPPFKTRRNVDFFFDAG